MARRKKVMLRDAATAKTMMRLLEDFLRVDGSKRVVGRVVYRRGSDPEKEVPFTQENLEAGQVLADALEEHPKMGHSQQLVSDLRYFVNSIGEMSNALTWKSLSKRIDWTDFSRFIDLLINTVNDLYDEEHQRATSPKPIIELAEQLTLPQRSTLAWLLENWPYPYRGSPMENVRGLVTLGLLHPPTEDTWGDATALGRRVWKYAKPTWIREHHLEVAYRRSEMSRPRRSR